ncbi:MAG: SDR family NAD(P)-dependent oxidoreductase [Actinobacteria bacterium]|nr:MAG: SDR family NAD(P)-dependent oxidoreductase [Actinomycetota bacterium]REK35062.1 MAG: SDR family NAD(P)-dependent oxidoreductase [Actinomycetota bacterium]
MKLRGKTLVVTGGGSGIGRALVLELLGRGASVAAVDLRSESLDETSAIADAGDRLASFTADVTDRDAIAALPGRVAGAFGAVDGYVSNAGIIQPFVKLNELDYDAIERVVNVNFYGTLHMAKAFLPHLLERPVAHIANVSSMGGFLPVPGQTIYGATKAAVKLMTEGLYAELLPTNVKVSVVFPGAVATNITENSGVEAPVDADDAGSDYPTTSAEDAARIICDGIESDQLHIYVGRDSRMMNILNRVAPRRSAHIIYRQMKDLLSS